VERGVSEEELEDMAQGWGTLPSISERAGASRQNHPNPDTWSRSRVQYCVRGAGAELGFS